MFRTDLVFFRNVLGGTGLFVGNHVIFVHAVILSVKKIGRVGYLRHLSVGSPPLQDPDSVV